MISNQHPIFPKSDSMTRPGSRSFLLSILMAIVLLCGVGCSDERSYTTHPDCRLEFSSDTLTFDTLFTELSSATYSFLLYNRHEAALRITDARLSGGDASPYRVNLDGLAGTEFSDITVRGGDSL